jgi:small-conductance mechanosensitive channel
MEASVIVSELNKFISSKLINAVIILTMLLIVKDFFSAIVSNFVDGLFFFFDSYFTAGNFITYNGEDVQIIKVGIIKTVLEKKDGTWILIYNSRMKYQNIEKKFGKGK